MFLFAKWHAGFKLKDTISVFPVLQDSAETLVMWGAKINKLLVVQFLSRPDSSAKNHETIGQCLLTLQTKMSGSFSGNTVYIGIWIQDTIIKCVSPCFWQGTYSYPIYSSWRVPQCMPMRWKPWNVQLKGAITSLPYNTDLYINLVHLPRKSAWYMSWY